MSDESIDVKVGQEFSVPLKTFATAGYLWKIESMPDGLRVVETKNKKPEGETKPGDPTVQVFKFQALEKGEHTIVFVLSRPWQGQAMDTRKVVVKAD